MIQTELFKNEENFEHNINYPVVTEKDGEYKVFFKDGTFVTFTNNRFLKFIAYSELYKNDFNDEIKGEYKVDEYNRIVKYNSKYSVSDYKREKILKLMENIKEKLNDLTNF